MAIRWEKGPSKRDVIETLQDFNAKLLQSVKSKKLKDVINKKGWAEIEKVDENGSHHYFGWNRIFIRESGPRNIHLIETCPKCGAKSIKNSRNKIIKLFFVRSYRNPKASVFNADEGWAILCGKCLYPIGVSQRLAAIT